MPLSLRSFSIASSRQQRWLRLAVGALAALIVWWLVSWLAIAHLAKGPLERIASEQLGRPVTVGAIEFTPWTLELTLRDIAIGGAQGGPPQLQIARIYADAELQSLVRLAPVVDALAIDAPHLRLTHLSDGHYDVDDILARLAAPSDKPASGPARLALYNLALTNGTIEFNDHRVDALHTVRQLALKVPFISTLPSQREIKVEPHLSFVVGDSRFDSSVQATPFAQTGKGDATVKWEGLDLAPYLPYLPASLPVRVQGALLDLDLKVAFEQAPRLAVTLSGTAQTRNVKIADRNNQPLLSYERLTVDMADVRPLDQVVRLARVELASPIVTAARNAQGAVNLAQLATPAAAAKPAAPARTSPAASAPQAPASSANPPAATAPAPGWTVAVAQAAVRKGQVRWSDQSTRPAAALEATDLTLDVADVAYPFKAPLTFTGALGVQGSTLAFKGQATDRAAEVRLTAQALALQLAAPYLAQTLEPVLTGLVSGELALQWQAPAGDAAKAGATGITLGAGPLALEQLALQQGKTALASVGKLALDGLKLNLDTRTVDIERLGITQPKATVERAADGRWMAERWLKSAPAASPSSATTAQASAPPPAAPAAPAWRVRLGELAVDEGSMAFADRAQPRPVALNLSALSLQARNLALDGGKPEAFQLSARVAARRGNAGFVESRGNAGIVESRGNAGKLDYRGTLTPQPFATQGRLEASRLPLHALDGYLADRFAIELLHAEAGFRGQVAMAQSARGTTLRVSGDAAIDELRANSTAAATPKTADQVGEELLAWKSLGLRGLSVALAPDTAPRVEVKETSLADFFARITINENGRINLSDIAKSPAQVNNTPPAADTAPAAPVAQAPSSPPDTPASTANATASASTALPPSPATPPDPLAPVVVFGPVSLVNGKVLFSDFFIKPNYSADLSELTGKLSAFSSQPAGSEPVLADLELRGRAEGSASLEITGKLNPLAKPLALDIQGKVRDLELPPLTPYSVKYAGHGIERGKLSMDVSYKVLPNGQLTASNKLVLNQLTFGDPVEGAPNSLPVKLAVALLSDSRGVIDLDLPISGSLNDPQFRIGPVIFKIIVNLIGKAITAPFSLLARAFGGGDELSSVAFAPGSAALTPEARQGLDKVAKALTERPALKITVTGTASLERERDAIQRERLQALVHAAKRRAAPADTTPVQAAEYPALLKEVYRRADMPKPRNLVGMAKDLPVPEMEALLLAHLPAATEDQATELATQRGQAVKAYLAEQKLPEERLFIAAPKAAKPDEKWTPQAQLNLATQ